jgi:hypothetical protein
MLRSVAKPSKEALIIRMAGQEILGDGKLVMGINSWNRRGNSRDLSRRSPGGGRINKIDFDQLSNVKIERFVHKKKQSWEMVSIDEGIPID